MALLFALNEGGYSSGHCSGLSPDSLFMQRGGRRSLHHQNAGKIRRCFIIPIPRPHMESCFRSAPARLLVFDLEILVGQIVSFIRLHDIRIESNLFDTKCRAIRSNTKLIYIRLHAIRSKSNLFHTKWRAIRCNTKLICFRLHAIRSKSKLFRMRCRAIRCNTKLILFRLHAIRSESNLLQCVSCA